MSEQRFERDDVERAVDFRAYYGEHLASLRVGHGSEATARCPFHDDRSPSLSVNLATGLFKCHGCEAQGSVFDFDMRVAAVGFEQAVDRLGARWVGARPSPDSAQRAIEKVYDYHDENGTLLFQVVRYRPKDFRQRRPDGLGGWDWNTNGVRRVPYRLPELIATVSAGGTVYVVEGEKDADALMAWDGTDGQMLTATCNPGGAGKWRPEYNEYFRGARVVIIADRDEVGRRHAWHVHGELVGTSASVRVVEPAAGKDLTDHLEAGLRLEQLVEVRPEPARPQHSEASAVTAPSLFTPAFIDVGSAMTEALRPIPYRLQPYLAGPDNLLIGGEWGSGKSPLAMSLAFSLALNVPFLGSVVPTGEPDIVGVLDEENSDHLVRQRLQLLGRGLGVDPVRAGQRIVYCGQSGWRDLSAADRRDALSRVVEERKVTRLILDSLVRFIGRRDENASTDMSGWYEEVVLWLNTQLGVRVVALHHWRKPSKDQNDPRHRFRGSSDIPAQFDQVWAYETTTDANTRNLLHVRSRWGETAPAVSVKREGGAWEGAMKLVAAGAKADAEALIWSAIVAGQSAGELRDKVVHQLVSAGFSDDAAEQACTRTLGRWKKVQRVVCRPEGRKARYWAAEFAPPDLLTTTFPAGVPFLTNETQETR